ncbi:Uu.00g109970.m01.CDS01 [Anthostomella pinea]|uniref:Uu.00g109970.m01.CDS01 n=1 Tax=Anthostomella pinea TaxID=933095 RepID=A0AAI8VES0_9PEZI|nr:Uu.00g109970.m01.CDS01 [Anthostomella pinea]
MSNSSADVSPLSSPDIRPDDIVFSGRSSPSPFFMDSPGATPRARDTHLRPNARGAPRSPRSPSRSTAANDSSLSNSPWLGPVRSRPIAIELPPPKKVNSAPVYTPPAPLSARGDLPGGYFPLHEEQNRVYRPHPFQLDASKARMKSIERASQSCSSATLATVSNVTATGTIPPTTTAPAAMAGRSMPPPKLSTTSLPKADSESRSNTPVASYMPIGSQDSPLPMGRYYPSNYEQQRKDEQRKIQLVRPMTSDMATSSVSMSDTQVPTVNQSPTSGHSRNESEAKRRLQQYQRDMIAQATLALNGGNVNQATLSSLRTIGFGSMSKPSKPMLAPLGSPGPVTPMELAGTEDGYLGARGDPNAESEEIARAIRVEEERKRREGASSPVVELGPSTF